jgi:hypothetical protein
VRTPDSAGVKAAAEAKSAEKVTSLADIVIGTVERERRLPICTASKKEETCQEG